MRHLQQSRLHSEMASNICFYNEDHEAARKVMAEFMKQAKTFIEAMLDPRKAGDFEELGIRPSDKRDISFMNIRCKAKIYNNPDDSSVKIAVENAGGSPLAKVEYYMEDGKLTEGNNEPVQIRFGLNVFRDPNAGVDDIPYNEKAERIIRRKGLVPAYWTSGYSHGVSWYCDGITREEAKELIEQGNGVDKGGMYEFIALSMFRPKKEDKLKAMQDMNNKINGED